MSGAESDIRAAPGSSPPPQPLLVPLELRRKGVEMLYGALTRSTGTLSGVDVLARDLEFHIQRGVRLECRYLNDPDKLKEQYRSRVRSRFFNLKANASLGQALVQGGVAADVVAGMSHDELASLAARQQKGGLVGGAAVADRSNK